MKYRFLIVAAALSLFSCKKKEYCYSCADPGGFPPTPNAFCATDKKMVDNARAYFNIPDSISDSRVNEIVNQYCTKSEK